MNSSEAAVLTFPQFPRNKQYDVNRDKGNREYNGCMNIHADIVAPVPRDSLSLHEA